MDYKYPLYAGSTNISDIDSLIRINKGKKVKISYLNNEFEGIIENSGQNYIILSNPNNGEWYILLNNNINFISSSEQINH